MLRSWLKGIEEGENLSVSISILRRNNVHSLLLTFPKLGTWEHPYPKKKSSLSFCRKEKKKKKPQQQQQKSMPTTMCLVTGNFYVEVGWVTRHNTVHCVAVSREQLEDSFLQAPGLIWGIYEIREFLSYAGVTAESWDKATHCVCPFPGSFTLLYKGIHFYPLEFKAGLN